MILSQAFRKRLWLVVEWDSYAIDKLVTEIGIAVVTEIGTHRDRDRQIVEKSECPQMVIFLHSLQPSNSCYDSYSISGITGTHPLEGNRHPRFLAKSLNNRPAWQAQPTPAQLLVLRPD